MPILQIISTSPFDSLTIEKAGADRIELVSALQIGGLTPSAGIIRKSLQCVNIPTMVMIRHHNNGFVNSNQQIRLFCEEVIQCKQMGVKGMVFGGILSNGQIDQELIKNLYQQINSDKIDITFHKAFDQTVNIVKSYQKLCDWKINRVLTQGGTDSLLKNIQVLTKIIQLSKDPSNTKVLLGGGISFQNVQQIISKLNPAQIHIGTCVRKNKYGSVLQEKVQEFIKLIKK